MVPPWWGTEEMLFVQRGCLEAAVRSQRSEFTREEASAQHVPSLLVLVHAALRGSAPPRVMRDRVHAQATLSAATDHPCTPWGVGTLSRVAPDLWRRSRWGVVTHVG